MTQCREINKSAHGSKQQHVIYTYAWVLSVEILTL